jgi:hypothetical protein
MLQEKFELASMEAKNNEIWLNWMKFSFIFIFSRENSLNFVKKNSLNFLKKKKFFKFFVMPYFDV